MFYLCLIQISDNGFIIAGYIEYGQMMWVGVVIKLIVSGDVEWLRVMGGGINIWWNVVIEVGDGYVFFGIWR